MVNPTITWTSETMFEVWDSCYSFDVAFFVNIQRHTQIQVTYQDVQGREKHTICKHALSELFQHEIDHLHGILATDHLKDPTQIIMRSEWEKRYNK